MTWMFFLSESNFHFIIHIIYVYLHTQRSSSQIRGANNIFHKWKKYVQLESRTRYFTCAKNDTSNQKPPQCVSFAPSFPLFMGTVSSVLELLCTPDTSLRASFPERSGVRKGKGRRACNYVSKIWISASKKSMRNADWRSDITNDVITLGKCFSMFVYIRARFPFALIDGNLTVQSTGSHRGYWRWSLHPRDVVASSSDIQG